MKTFSSTHYFNLLANPELLEKTTKHWSLNLLSKASYLLCLSLAFPVAPFFMAEELVFKFFGVLLGFTIGGMVTLGAMGLGEQIKKLLYQRLGLDPAIATAFSEEYSSEQKVELIKKLEEYESSIDGALFSKIANLIYKGECSKIWWAHLSSALKATGVESQKKAQVDKERASASLLLSKMAEFETRALGHEAESVLMGCSVLSTEKLDLNSMVTQNNKVLSLK